MRQTRRRAAPKNIAPAAANPVAEVIEAIGRAAGSKLQWRPFLLDGPESLVAAIRAALDTFGGKEPSPGNQMKTLLIRPPNRRERSRYAPWEELVASVLTTTRTGEVADLDVVPMLLTEDRRAVPSAQATEAPVISNLNIQPELAPTTSEEIERARADLANWAFLETLTGPKYRSAFSRLAGGLRPSVVVLDDYNNYIRFVDGRFVPFGFDELEKPAHDEYNTTAQGFAGFLHGHCGVLNNLLAAFDVMQLRLWLGGDGAAGYEKVAQALPFDLLDDVRGRLAAFVVNLEWRRTLSVGKEATKCPWVPAVPDWSTMGHRAVHLLALRYPEIPCFLFTGQWEVRKLQEALAHGAAWCFFKGDTHHPYAEPLPHRPSAQDGDLLTAVELERHLAEAAQNRYGVFADAPYPGQLMLRSDREASRRLMNRLGLRLPLARTARGQSLIRLIAALFPDGAKIEPIKVLTSGRSAAQATFFARIERAGMGDATRFIKVASWWSIEREHRGYRRVVQPRLNTHAAQAVGRPVVSRDPQGEMPLGALMYSMAGLPERSEELQSLDEALEALQRDPKAAKIVAKRVRSTLETVLAPLHGTEAKEPAEVLRRRKYPLWRWLGEVLPPVFTGVLETSEAARGGPGAIEITGRRAGGKDQLTWILASNRIPDLAGGPGELRARLAGFELLEIEWGEKSPEIGEITLRHPDLGLRFRLRGKADDIRRRFGDTWVTAGMPVEVFARLDAENREMGRFQDALWRAGKDAGIAEGNEGETRETLLELAAVALGAVPVVDPLPCFFGRGPVALHYTIEARRGPIHGDLNPRNILFSGDGGPGWLIDFEQAAEEGMLAFDLAKLEVEIWHHHLFPKLQQLAARDPKRGAALLGAALAAADVDVDPGEVFSTKVRESTLLPQATDRLLAPVSSLLEVIAEIRRFAIKHRMSSELRWALAAYFFVVIKFSHKGASWGPVLAYVASAWHLREVAPHRPSQAESSFPAVKSILADLVAGKVAPAQHPQVDGLLLEVQAGLLGPGSRGNKIPLREFTAEMARTARGARVDWGRKSVPERWDLASTGSITNITPILGYLWLMSRARQTKRGDRYGMVVPKISSRGRSCGTVDVLESGGFRFPSDPEVIRDECLRSGGVLCRQDPNLTPVDRALMARRKTINAMKDPALTCASVLSKKLVMGCTHVVVDVKVGLDTKMVAPWMKVDWLESLAGNGDEDLVVRGERFHVFAKLLKELNGPAETCTLPDGMVYLRQTQAKYLPEGLKEIRWFLTNADVPQCRSIGRHLTLLHLEGLLEGSYRDEEGRERKEWLIADQPSSEKHFQLYRSLLPRLCDADPASYEMVKKEWALLKAKLPRRHDSAARKCLSRWFPLGPDDEKVQVETVHDLSGDAGDLAVMSFGAHPYAQGSLRTSSLVVQRIAAFPLDVLFEWLCGDDDRDEEVGIWLHRLPGEEVRPRDVFLTIFFRPSRCSVAEVKHKVRAFISDHVVLGEPL